MHCAIAHYHYAVRAHARFRLYQGVILQGFKLATIQGFEIRVDLSWLLIFSLILWTLSTDFFPLSYPGLSRGGYILMGVIGTLMFFFSLLLHELSHSFVARAKGIPVEGITLFAFGGVSRTKMEAETPGDEFQIAGVGPLTSLLLSGIFALISYTSQSAGWNLIITGIAAYLSWINLILAIFNLLPGFPLDGGRLFRSIVWKFTGNLQKATRIASAGGRLLGFSLIAWGFLQLFSPAPNFIGGLWTILIGWFLNNAAQASYQDLVIRTALEGVQAQQIMTLSPETVPADLNLQTLFDEYFFNRSYQSFPVMESEAPIGMVTLQQAKQVAREQWSSTSVKQVMKAVGKGIAIRPEVDMTAVLDAMRESRSRRLLVIDNGQLRGIISATDLANWLQRKRSFGDAVPEQKTPTEQRIREMQSSQA